MKRSQSQLFAPEPKKTVRHLVASTSEFPSSTPAIDPSLAFVDEFLSKLESNLSGLILVSVSLIQVKLRLSKGLDFLLETSSQPRGYWDISQLLGVFDRSFKEYQTLSRPEYTLLANIRFYQFLSTLSHKAQWLNILKKTKSEREKMISTEVTPAKGQTTLKQLVNKIHDAEPSQKKHYRDLLFSENETHQTIVTSLKKPKGIKARIEAEQSLYDKQIQKCKAELSYLYLVLMRSEQLLLKQYSICLDVLIRHLKSYPLELEIQSSWPDKSTFMINSLRILLSGDNLADLFVLKSSIHFPTALKTLDDDGEFGYFVDFPDLELQHVMEIYTNIGSGYFYGGFESLLALNSILDVVAQKTKQFKVYAPQRPATFTLG